MINPLNTLLRTPVDDGSHYRWGYVTSTSPTLQVVLDTETSPIQKPSTLVPLEVGDRVFVLLESRRATVLGTATTLGRYDPHLSLYTPPGYSHAAWRNRVLAAKYGRATTVAVVGSSSVAGIGATTIPQGWAHLLRGRFADAGYPIQGTGLALVGTAKLASDPRWTFSASGVSAPMTVDATIENGAWAEYTTDVPGAWVRVFYYNDGGAFTITINGGTPVTITPTGAASVTSWTNPASLGLGLHTVRITGTSGTPARVVGIDSFTLATNGICVTVAGIGATTSATWSTFYYTSATVNALRRVPALTIFAVNGNDFTLGVPRETTRSRYVSMVNGVRFFASEPLFVIMPVTSTADFAAYREHASALYEVADEKGVALIDMADRWGTYSQISAAGLSADGVHPSQSGHELYADAIFDVIGA